MQVFRKLLLTISGVFSTVVLFSQNYEQVWFDNTDSAYGFYTVIRPAGPRIQGAVVLFDGYGGDAASLYRESKIQNIAYANEMLTVSIPTGHQLFLDDAHAATIKKILHEVARQYGIQKDHFAIGGFSAGGALALRYTELSYEHPEEFEVRPRAVFTADAPIDLLALYQSSERELRYKSRGWWLGEAQMIMKNLDQNLGVLPGGMNNYRKISPFIASDTAEGNEKWLYTVPYRTYHDVDVEWQIKNRDRSLYDLNMLGASELIRRLREAGNLNAEFIASKTPGRRANGQFHPHSWNIVDETDLVVWLREKLSFYPGDISKRYTYTAGNWRQEVILLPFFFAPEITYKGYEDLRFAPGWDNATSDEKWAYTIVWWLDGKYTFSEDLLRKDLESYYTGLTKQRAATDHDDMTLFTPAKATVKTTDTESGDLSTFSAHILIFDSEVTKKPGDLYLKVHVKKCADTLRTILFLEVSGYPSTAPIWKTLDNIQSHFICP